MRSCTLFVLFGLLCNSTRATIHDVYFGQFEAPDDLIFKRTGTIDSFQGTLTRRSDNFVISFDIGEMAGAQMFPTCKNRCIFFRTSKVNGNFAFTGFERIDSKTKVTTTIWDAGERIRLRERIPKKDIIPPANFWAYVSGESDLAEFMLVVSSYLPKATPEKTKQSPAATP